MDEGNEHLLTTFGESVTYTPKGGSPVTITAIAGRIEGEIGEVDDGSEVELKHRKISVLISDIAEPAAGDIVTVGGVDWIVIQPPDIEAGMAELQCRTDTPLSKHHESHKRKIE